jgi:hypothetical protein
VCVYAYIRICIHTYIRIDIRIYIRIYIHSYPSNGWIAGWVHGWVAGWVHGFINISDMFLVTGGKGREYMLMTHMMSNEEWRSLECLLLEKFLKT